jgi:hypothetical protein
LEATIDDFHAALRSGRTTCRELVEFYSTISAATEKIETAEATTITPTSQHLFAHLLDNGFIEPVRELDTRQLHVNPSDVLKMIQSGDAAWVDFVPPKAAAFIRREGLFGYHDGAVDGPTGK